MHIRNIEDGDKPILSKLIEKDEHHIETTPDFFYADRSRCVVYESDDKEHQLFVKMSNSLRLDIQFDNDDHLFNAKTMLSSFPKLAAWAKNKGFVEIVFCSSSPGLITLLQKKFGFQPIGNEFRVAL